MLVFVKMSLLGREMKERLEEIGLKARLTLSMPIPSLMAKRPLHTRAKHYSQSEPLIYANVNSGEAGAKDLIELMKNRVIWVSVPIEEKYQQEFRGGIFAETEEIPMVVKDLIYDGKRMSRLLLEMFHCEGNPIPMNRKDRRRLPKPYSLE